MAATRATTIPAGVVASLNGPQRAHSAPLLQSAANLVGAAAARRPPNHHLCGAELRAPPCGMAESESLSTRSPCLWARVVALLGVLLISAQCPADRRSIGQRSGALAAQARAHSLRDRDRTRHRVCAPHSGRERASELRRNADVRDGAVLEARQPASAVLRQGGRGAPTAQAVGREAHLQKSPPAARELAVESREAELATQIVIASRAAG